MTQLHRRYFSLVLRLAFVASVLNALIPTIAYEVSAARGEHVVEICTAFGAKRIRVDAEGHPVGQPASSGLHGHCGYCLPGQDAQLQHGAIVLDFTPPQVFTPSTLGMGVWRHVASRSWHVPPSQAPPLTLPA